MTTNNAHIRLRRRTERLLGRPIRDAAWDVATRRTFVDDALDPAYAKGEENLLAFLRDLLWVEDGSLRPSTRPKGTSGRPIPRPVDSSARIVAVSRLAADHAAGDDEILRFRQRVLQRDTPLSADEAEAYLDLPEARQSRRPQSADRGPSEVLRYQNRHVSHDLRVWSDSPLDELRKLADHLTESYPWQPAQAAAFVLEGLIPLATPFMLRLPQAWHDGRPRRSKLIMEVDLWMPAGAVVNAYRRVQREVLPGHNKPVSKRSIEVVNFVMRHRPETWQKLFERWNTEHPDHPYASYRNFRYAFDRASQSLLHPTYRFWSGEGH
jgi:hypothetical protein